MGVKFILNLKKSEKKKLQDILSEYHAAQAFDPRRTNNVLDVCCTN